MRHFLARNSASFKSPGAFHIMPALPIQCTLQHLIFIILGSVKPYLLLLAEESYPLLNAASGREVAKRLSRKILTS